MRLSEPKPSDHVKSADIGNLLLSLHIFPLCRSFFLSHAPGTVGAIRWCRARVYECSILLRNQDLHGFDAAECGMQ